MLSQSSYESFPSAVVHIIDIFRKICQVLQCLPNHLKPLRFIMRFFVPFQVYRPEPSFL